ncbi:hypothetical protein Golax_015149 [Gossypium laxum]|uniref:Uncharacterized protein n=1 Tax=Gossypium laxum TaxID=34288 RepID=A0A7J8ZYC7_9ROSI|nr:hypothetical protein [Gossypium laxum]
MVVRFWRLGVEMAVLPFLYCAMRPYRELKRS